MISKIVSGVIILSIIIYIYYIQFAIPVYPKIQLEELIKHVKTGDMILFKASNNFNSVKIGCRYTHIAMVYIPNGENTKPLLFEANRTDGMNLLEHQNHKGIFVSPMLERLQKYKGYLYYRPINKKLTNIMVSEMEIFIKYCINNMYYDTNLLQSALRNKFGKKRCDHGTNCGEILFLTLIKMGLIPISQYDMPKLHYLFNLSHNNLLLNNEYSYSTKYMIVDHPFASDNISSV